MASEFPVDPEKLKKLIKASRRIPAAFGYNPGTTDDDDEYLAAHLRKPPEVLGRIALHDGAGTRSAFGTFQVAGTELRLTCVRSIKQMAKKFKRYLRLRKIYLNVVVLDPEGNIVDSDVEDLAEVFDLGDEDEAWIDDPDEAPETEPEAGTEAAREPAAAPAAAAIPARIAQRLLALRSGLAGLPAPAAERAAAGLAGVVALLRDGRTDEAAAALMRIETVLARPRPEHRAAGAAPDTTADSTPGARPGAAPAPDREAPVAQRLAAALDAAAERIDGLDGPPADALRDRLAGARDSLSAGDAAAALAALRRVQAGIARAERARDTWVRAVRSIERPLQAALAGPAPTGLRAAWDHAAALASAGAHERALRALPPVADGLRAAR